LIVGLNASFSYNCGAALNPARDFSPRLFLLMVGYGPDLFTAYDYFFWVPVITTCIGGLFGAFLYQVFVGFYNKKPDLKKKRTRYLSEDNKKNTILAYF